jgi:hypothetical protein
LKLEMSASVVPSGDHAIFDEYANGVIHAIPTCPCVDGSGQLGTVCGISPSVQMQPNEAQKQNAKIEQLENRLAALEALLSSQTATAARPTSSQ